MNQPFEIIETQRKRRLVVLVEASPFLLIRYATWWERLVYRWQEWRFDERRWKAAVATEEAIKRAAKAGVH